MKKILPVLLLVGLISAVAAWPASASSTIIKGEITGINPADWTITVLTSHGLSVTITAPDDFDAMALETGEQVIARGELLEDGSIKADLIKLVGQVDGSEGDTGSGHAFCSSGKKQVPHPMAVKIAEKYGVTSAWVMSYYCKGFSMGDIMLAVKTSELAGSGADEMLLKRSNGNAWGQIWQELNLIGSGKADKTPPGQLNKVDKPDNGHH